MFLPHIGLILPSLVQKTCLLGVDIESKIILYECSTKYHYLAVMLDIVASLCQGYNPRVRYPCSGTSNLNYRYNCSHASIKDICENVLLYINVYNTLIIQPFYNIM